MVVVATPQEAVKRVLARVVDPEIPELSIVDLGIVRGVDALPDGGWRVLITPTYSGCPAFETICQDIIAALTEAGFAPIEIKRVISPPWSTDWLSEQAKDTLRAIGIAPPGAATEPKPLVFFESPPVSCPRCGAADTELISEFGATACKSLRRCRRCREPFEHVKPI